MTKQRISSAYRLVGAVLFVCALGACGEEPAEPPPQSTAQGATDTTLEAEQELESVLRNAAVAQESYYTMNTTYTTSVADLEAEGLQMERGVTLSISSMTADGYCMIAHHASIDVTYMYDSTAGEVTEGFC